MGEKRKTLSLGTMVQENNVSNKTVENKVSDKLKHFEYFFQILLVVVEAFVQFYSAK